MSKKFLSTIVTAMLMVGALAFPTNASTPSVLNNWYTLTWGSLPKLYQVNKTDGTLTQVAVATSAVGSAGNTGAAGLDIDSTNGLGYFVPYSNNPTSLWKIDLTTGNFTEVGRTLAINVTALDLGISGNIWIAADNLDGQGRGFGKIDRNTAQATYLAAGPERISALATSADGVLYAFSYSNKVYTVNTTTFAFTLVGSTNASMKAADFDSSGEIILQTWGGSISGYSLSSNTDTAKFTMSINGTGINGEAFAIGGPTDGRTLNQAIAGAPIPGQATPTPTPTPSSSSTPVAAPSPSINLFKFAFGVSNMTTKLKNSIKSVVDSAPLNSTYEVTGVAGKIPGISNKKVQKLADNRANKVRNYLISIGVPNEAISVKTQIVEFKVSPKLKISLNKSL